MKKTVILILLSGSVLFFANCHPKVYPVASDKQVNADKQVAVNKSNKAPETVTTVAGFTAEQKAQGKTIFENECNKCHDLPSPGEHDLNGWNDILPKMFDKAEMSNDKSLMVRAYVISNAKPS